MRVHVPSLAWAAALAFGALLTPPSQAGNGTFDSATGKFNMVVSLRFNATAAEQQAICDEFETASGILLDATDGGNQLGLLLIANNSTASNAADYWVLKQSGTSSAPTCTFGTYGNHVTLYRGAGSPAARWEEVIVHETAHFVYCVRDEYEGPVSGGCGASSCNGTSAVCIGNGAGSACLMEGPDANDSEFCWSGNHDPDLDTEQECDHCESCWETIAGAGYGVTLPAGAPVEAAPSADPIACIFLDDVPRVMLVLDRSGSMLGDRIADAKKAARLVVDLVENGTYLGVASFATSAGPAPDYDMQTLDNAGDRTAAKAAINALVASGATNYSAGLDVAYDEFVDVGLGAANKSVIFLSDGANNRPLPDPDAALDASMAILIGDQIVVNTIGIGDDLALVDENRLRDMATDSGGEYSRSPVPVSPLQGSGAQSLSDMRPVFARYWASSEERTEIDCEAFELGFAELRCEPVFVDATTAQATFLATWDDGFGPLFRLVSPSGTTIFPSDSGSPGILFVSDFNSGYAFFKISAPAIEPGEWMFCMQNGEPPGLTAGGPQEIGFGQTTFNTQVFSRSMDVWATCKTLPAAPIGMGQDVLVQATAYFQAPLSDHPSDTVELPRVAGGNGGEFTFMGRVMNAEGTVVASFPMSDDGMSDADEEDGDGVFTGMVASSVLASLPPASYSVEIMIMNRGGAFYAGAHAKPVVGDNPPPIPDFDRTCNTSFVFAPGLVQNQPPTADAGPDRLAECSSSNGTPVALDGTGSFDPDGDPLIYSWSAPGITFDDDSSPNPTGAFPLGTTTVTLTVSDGSLMDSDTVDVTVVDTTPPVITVELEPDMLWPPNHRLRDIEATVIVVDVCDANAGFVLTSITSDEPDNGTGDGNTTNDIQDAEFGTPDTHFRLRAERAGPGDGRVYTVVYTATDSSGNVAQATATVVVPHNL